VTEVTYPHKMISFGYWDLAADTPTRRYQIIVSGCLGGAAREAFRDFLIEPHGTDTALTGDLNRSGLYDTLGRIRDLTLDLVGLTCPAPGPGFGHQPEAPGQSLRMSLVPVTEGQPAVVAGG
jgi:hypothetical protein